MHLNFRHDHLAQKSGVVDHAEGSDERQMTPLVACHGPHMALLSSQKGSSSPWILKFACG